MIIIIVVTMEGEEQKTSKDCSFPNLTRFFVSIKKVFLNLNARINKSIKKEQSSNIPYGE